MNEENKVIPETDATDVKTKKAEEKTDLFDWVQCVVAALLICILVFIFVGRTVSVSGPSMESTLFSGERVLISNLFYTPKQGDIVVANDTTQSSVELLHGDAIIKRVIATEGQTVDIDYDNNVVYIDGEPLEEDYILEEMRWPVWSSAMMETHFEVPEGEVFLMGDNRNGSTDSRHEMLGCVNEGHLLGRAAFVLFPFNRFGFV